MAEAEGSKQNNTQVKKRTRNPSEWKREKRKRLRVAGKAYVNSRGDIVDERKIGEDCRCRRKCYALVTEEERHKLFVGYYSLNSHDEQNAYLFGLIRKTEIARKRSKESDRRTCSYKYFVRTKGKEIQICRLAFAHIHGISPHKIRILCQKQDQNIMFPRDGRGKHDNRPRKVSTETLTQIKDHIYSIIKSDRVRDFLKEEKHNGPDLNITKMWKDYLEQFDPNFYVLHLGNEKINMSHPTNGIEVPHEGVSLPGFSGMESHQGLTHQHVGPYAHVPDLTHFQMTGMNHNINLMGHHSESRYINRDEESHNNQEDKKRHVPIVKHWLYSRVFHEEFKFHDFLTLKKKLWHLKDTDKVESNQVINKAERKQKTPKKISREKDSGVNVVGLQTLNPMGADHMSSSIHHNQMQSLATSQDMYILPVNLQDLQLPQASDMISQQHHAMQLNLHTFSTQNVLSPLMNVQGSGAQGLQCSSVVALPGGTMSLAQNSSGYMNVNTASFYQ
ncbi:uncharacterized protein LOC110832095 [Zootermopsis nevadensis]|uniref:Uncharacterized protein n=1 Tax=Zootermopsis nevadensis TaxID=136037 RepID=A0A067R1X2_ZOONE|nr:uncharacterized protein LOC110832095 [Zootermopsis nevadensis]KDR17003.1 hypothetical protein L798_09012 [Zootermopsis nevadensis]